MPAAGALPSLRFGSGLARRSLSELRRVASGFFQRQPSSPLPEVVYTEGHARDYFTGRPMPPLAPRQRINLNAPVSISQTVSSSPASMEPPRQLSNLNPQAQVFTPQHPNPHIKCTASIPPPRQPTNSNPQASPSQRTSNPQVPMAPYNLQINYAVLRGNDHFMQAISQ